MRLGGFIIWFPLVLVICMGRLHAQECPSIQSPADGATGVPVDASISWTSVEGVPSYLISIGTTPGGTDIINGFNVGSATQFSPPLGLPQNTQLYVTLTLFFFDRPNIPCPSTTFTTQEVLTPPACTTVATPVDGATGVNGATNISWNYAPTATGYRLHIGTTPGGGDILNNADVGNVLTYNPPTDFPPNSQIYVQVTPYNGNGPAIPQCNGSSFTTGDVAVLPNCTQLVSPYNGETNVPLTPFIEWEAVPNADGYRVTIGSSPFASDILDNASFSTNATLVIDFEPNRTFFITIIPFNTAGEAIGCSQEQFSTLVGCGPFYDPDSGELVSLHPEFDFPGTVGICQDSPTVLEASGADGYRWYRLHPNEREELLSETPQLSVSEEGDYRVVAYNTFDQSGNTFECETPRDFTVTASEKVISIALDIGEEGNGQFSVTVEVEGSGDYEYALNDINGPYQDSNRFDLVDQGESVFYVRDKNGCGIGEKTLDGIISVEGFPKFFTPNNDGKNDYWQYKPPNDLSKDTAPRDIYIYDRYGGFMGQIDPESKGWDGEFKGIPLPSSDYWYVAILHDGQTVRGHFSLKR